MSDLSQYIGDLDNSALEDVSDNSPLPKGEYYVEVEKAEGKNTANGQGFGLNTTFHVIGSVTDKSHAGRKLFNWFNLRHANETAEKIGRAEFQALRVAVGKPMSIDSDELLGVPIIVKVDIDKKDAERNVIKAYKAADAAPESTPAPAPATPPAATTAKKPWER